MRVVFRTDASVQIGIGHVMRCLTLAGELTRQGHECWFVCREHIGHLGELVASKGHGLSLLPAPMNHQEYNACDNSDDYAVWLGVPWQEDATQTVDAITPLKPDWLVVDHYALDAKWERTFARAVGNIMVIDDLANRRHECAVLLDQNVLDHSIAQRYQKLVSENCSLLLGPKYALLSPEYAELAKALPERDGFISRVLIFVGGSDPHHLTERCLQAIDAHEFDCLFVDVVLGRNHPSPEAVQKLVAKRPKTRLYTGLPSLAALMVRADLMLGAGGATNWERMCLGLNSIVVSVAQNQDEVNEALGRQQLIRFLGKAECVSVDQIKVALGDVIDSPINHATQSKRVSQLVDGAGCQQVSQLLLSKQSL